MVGRSEKSKTHDFAIRLKLLREVPVFEGLSDDTYIAMARNFERIVFSEGDQIMIEGESGSDMFFVIDGNPVASVLKFGVVKVFDEGDFFGELACVSDVPRTATVVADMDTICWRLGREGVLGACTEAELQRIIGSRTFSYQQDRVNAARAGEAAPLLNLIMPMGNATMLYGKNCPDERALFGRMDIDQDGFITNADLNLALINMRIDDGLRKHIRHMYFGEGQGLISFDTFSVRLGATVIFSQLHTSEEYVCPPGQDEPREPLSDEAEARLRSLGLPPEEEARMRDVLEVEAGRIAALLRGSEPSIEQIPSLSKPTEEEMDAAKDARVRKAVLTTVRTTRSTLHRLVWTRRFWASRDTHQPLVHTTPAYGTVPNVPVEQLRARPPPVRRAATGHPSSARSASADHHRPRSTRAAAAAAAGGGGGSGGISGAVTERPSTTGGVGVRGKARRRVLQRGQRTPAYYASAAAADIAAQQQGRAQTAPAGARRRQPPDAACRSGRPDTTRVPSAEGYVGGSSSHVHDEGGEPAQQYQHRDAAHRDRDQPEYEPQQQQQQQEEEEEEEEEQEEQEERQEEGLVQGREFERSGGASSVATEDVAPGRPWAPPRPATAAFSGSTPRDFFGGRRARGGWGATSRPSQERYAAAVQAATRQVTFTRNGTPVRGMRWVSGAPAHQRIQLRAGTGGAMLGPPPLNDGRYKETSSRCGSRAMSAPAGAMRNYLAHERLLKSAAHGRPQRSPRSAGAGGARPAARSAGSGQRQKASKTSNAHTTTAAGSNSGGSGAAAAAAGHVVVVPRFWGEEATSNPPSTHAVESH